MKKITTLLSALALTAFGFQANAQCPAPSDLANPNPAPTSANLTWTENGSATEWEIELTVGPGSTFTGTPTHSNITTNPYNITGLTVSTIHKAQVRSVCGGNTSDWYGPVYVLTTAAGATCDAPTALTATMITATSTNLGWTNGAAGTPADWTISYGEAGYTLGDPAAGEIATPTATMNPYALTGLTAGTTYDFYVMANCGSADGTSPWSSKKTFTAGVTGINTVANNIKIAAYPNPTTGAFTLNVNTTDVNELNIKVMNMQGQVVFAKSNFDNIATIQEVIDLSSNANGIYIITITSDKGVATHKVTVQ